VTTAATPTAAASTTTVSIVSPRSQPQRRTLQPGQHSHTRNQPQVPSLTSLLRPPSILNRSTTSTRPTTPDSSDVETPLDTEAAVAHSARRAHPLPPTSPKVPTYEYYGFVLYLASSLIFVLYILWSYLPSPFLHALGITYYPNRWWSLAMPAWIVMLLVYIYVALACYNVETLTLPLENLECIVDDAGSIAVLDERARLRRGGSKRLVADWAAATRKARSSLASTGSKPRARNKGRKKPTSRDTSKSRSVAALHRPSEIELARGGNMLRDDDPADDWLAFVAEYGPAANPASMDLSWNQIWNQGTDAVMDVPLGGVCEVLYGE
jgi:phosphatidylinositol N-acetylglucosaminyltransferase subunit P